MSAVGLRCARPALGAPASGSRPPCAATAPASAFDVSMRIAALTGASSVEMSEVDDHIGSGIEKGLTIGRHQERLIGTSDLTHVETSVMGVDRGDQFQSRIVVNRTADRAAHTTASTEDSDSQGHDPKLAVGEAFECC